MRQGSCYSLSTRSEGSGRKVKTVKSSQQLSSGPGLKSTQTDPGPCSLPFHIASFAQSPGSWPTPHHPHRPHRPHHCPPRPSPLRRFSLPYHQVWDMTGMNVASLSLMTIFSQLWGFSWNSRIDSLNLNIGSVTTGMRLPAICQLDFCQRSAFNF